MVRCWAVGKIGGGSVETGSGAIVCGGVAVVGFGMGSTAAVGVGVMTGAVGYRVGRGESGATWACRWSNGDGWIGNGVTDVGVCGYDRR